MGACELISAGKRGKKEGKEGRLKGLRTRCSSDFDPREGEKETDRQIKLISRGVHGGEKEREEKKKKARALGRIFTGKEKEMRREERPSPSILSHFAERRRKREGRKD